VDLIETVAIVSAFGVIGALIFNGLTLRKDQKSRHYQAFMDLETEREKIQLVFPKIRDMIDLTSTEVKKYPEERQIELKTYQWKFIQFHDKVAHLALTGVIPKSIAKYFKDTFPQALAMLDLSLNPDEVKKHTKYLHVWCKNENITAYE
jgi:hypothetical protein